MSRKASNSGKNYKGKESDYKYYSQKLGFKVDETCNIILMQESLSWIGVPYKFGGKNKSGVDCSALVNNIYKTVYEKKSPRTVGEMFDKASKIKKDRLWRIY